MLENKVLKEVSGRKRDKVKRKWSTTGNFKIRPPNTVRVTNL